MTSKKKTHYSVVRGYKIGIFDSWEKCKKNVNGFKNAKFRGFYHYNEAKKWYNDNKIENNDYVIFIDSRGDWDTEPYTENDKVYLSVDWLYKNITLSPQQKNKLNDIL